MYKIIKMAERKISGKDKLLFIDPAGGTDYSLIICLTSQSMSRTSSVIDAASKCGPDKLPGEKEITVEFEGQEVVDPDADRISEAELHDIWEDDTIVSFKYGKATPISGDVTYTGTAILSDLVNNAGLNDPSTFTGTLQVKGNATKVVTP